MKSFFLNKGVVYKPMNDANDILGIFQLSEAANICVQ